MIIALAGLGLGFVMGATARAGRFCTFGAIEDLVLAGKTLRLRAWALAIAVAIICVQFMLHAGFARIDEVFYLQARIGFASSIVGGLLFGLGMAMVGTCGYGVVVRMAGGDLKAFCSFLMLGLTGYITARGLLSYVKVYTFDQIFIEASAAGGQGVPHFLAWASGLDVSMLWLPAGLVTGGLIVIYCFMCPLFRRSRRDIIAGCLIGLAVAGGFAVTGHLGAESFSPVRVQSLTYVLPLGETLIWLMTFTGASITFAIGAVVGTFFGALAVALFKREFHWEAFDDMREMRRHLLGAAAMGAGGVTALGCTIGQGISGISTLAVSPMLTLASILAGATFGLHWLLTGSASEAWQTLCSRRPN